jgi:serine/threonine protein kinase
VPTCGVLSIWFGEASDTLPLRDSRIFLNDFGESFQPAVEMRQSSHTPFILRSPEILLEPTSNVPVSFPAEIWSLACAIFAIMGQRPLFETWFPDEDRILEEHVDALGYLPEELWKHWTHRHHCFDDQLQRVDGSPRRLLEDRLEDSIQEPRKQSGMVEMDEEEKQTFLVLLKSMLSFRPGNRPSAQRVLESSWMQQWAEPAFESLKGNVETPETPL